MVGMQMQPPSASDIASKLIDALDTNGDGVVSQDEVDAALKNAGSNADTTKAFAAIDTDGDGKLSKDELTAAVANKIAEHHGHGHHHRHGGPSATDGAEMLLSSFDTDNDKSLSLAEVAKALGTDATDSNLSSAFGSLDSNGDGSLSSDELTSAIQARMDAALKAYTTTQQASAA